MITYTNNTNEIYYDTKMIKDILGVNLSFLKRQMKDYNFAAGSYIKYGNKHLFREEQVIDFINYIITNQFIRKTKKELVK